MRKLFLFIAIVLVSVVLGLYVKQDTGYILIIYNNISIELSFWLAVLLIFFSFFIIYNLIKLYKFIFNIPVKLGYWQENYKNRKKAYKINKGLLNYAEGKYEQAENLLISCAAKDKNSLVNYLIAAKSAQEQKDINKRDKYLKLAYECSSGSNLSIGLVQANLQLLNHEYESAVATLSNLKEKYYNNKLVLKYLYQAYFNLKDWSSIIELLPILYKHKVFSIQELFDYEILAAKNYFDKYSNNINSSIDNNKIKIFYNHLNKKVKNTIEVIVSYVNCLYKLDLEQKDYYINLLDQAIKRAYYEHNNLGSLSSLSNVVNLSKISDLSDLSKNSSQIDLSRAEALFLFASLGNTDNDLNILEKHLKYDNYNINLLFSLGLISIKLEYFDKAYQYLIQAKKLMNANQNSNHNINHKFINSNFKSLPIDNYLAFVLLKQGKDKQSLELFENYFKTYQQV